MSLFVINVVTTTIDDSSHLVPDCIDALDRYGVKATIAISTQREPILELWPRLRQAIDNGRSFEHVMELCMQGREWFDEHREAALLYE